jgi:beta-N-acetylhexosaminidase
VFAITPLRRSWPVALLVFSLALCSGCSSADSGHDNGKRTAAAAALTAVRTTGEACVQQTFGELTAGQRAGQLVMAGVPAGTPGSKKTLASKNHLGGVFLAGRSSHSPSTIKRSVALLPGQKTAHARIALLVGVDQEGGKVQTLRGGTWTTIPAATTQGGWSTAKLTSRTRAWVGQLKSAGVTMDLAPVADTVPPGTAKRNPPIGAFNRQYGSTSTSVAAAVTTVTSTMQAAGVIPTVKHFPGLGRVRHNTDTSTRAVDSATTVTDPYLKPFRAGIDAGAGAVMVSSASYPKLDADHLAVFSKAVVTGLLRTRMKYQGVVMTDDVSKAVAVKSVPMGQRATKFIAAGGDLVLAVVSADAPVMTKAISAKARTSSTFRAQVNTATLRVLRLKQSSGLLTCS